MASSIFGHVNFPDSKLAAVTTRGGQTTIAFLACQAAGDIYRANDGVATTSLHFQRARIGCVELGGSCALLNHIKWSAPFVSEPQPRRAVEANKNRVKGRMEAMKWTIMHSEDNQPVRPINVFVSCNYDVDGEWGMGKEEACAAEKQEGEDVTTKKSTGRSTPPRRRNLTAPLDRLGGNLRGTLMVNA